MRIRFDLQVQCHDPFADARLALLPQEGQSFTSFRRFVEGVMLVRQAVREFAVELGFSLALVQVHFYLFRHPLGLPRDPLVEEAHKDFDATVRASNIKRGPATQNAQRANASRSARA